MAEVYWIHLPEHTDVFSEGYVGVTARDTQTRFKEHLALSMRGKDAVHLAIQKYGDKIVVNTVCICEEPYAYGLEFKLRPEKRIGWNIQKGGFSPPNMKGKKVPRRIRIKGTPEHRKKVSEQMSNWWANKTEAERKALTKHLRTAPKNTEAWNKYVESRRGVSPSEETLDKMSLAQKEYARVHKDEKVAAALKMRGKALNTPWLISDARTDVWESAQEIHKLCVENPMLPFSVILKLHGKFKRDDAGALARRISSGWVPDEDIGWVSWMESRRRNNVT